jgi:hypothetical protein
VDQIVDTVSRDREDSRRLLRRPSWISLYLVLVLIFVCTELVLYPEQIERTLRLLPPSAGVVAQNAIRSALSDDMVKQLMILPLRLLASFMLVGVFLNVVCGALRNTGPVRFRHFLAVEIRAEYAFALQALVSAALVVAGFSPPALPVTLIDASMLISPGSSLTVILCQKLNLFSALYVMMLAAGIRGTGLFRRLPSLVIAFVCWSGQTLLGAAFLRLLSESFGFFG